MIGDGLMHARLRRGEMSLGEKLWQVSWSFVLLIAVLAGIGVAMLYSAANGDMDPWASRHITRFGVGLALLLAVAMIDVRQWMRYAYWLYGLAFVLLVAVEVKGTVGMGAQRWIDLGFFQIQPSELMKVALVLALARVFHGADLSDVGRPLFLLVPTLMVLVPVALVLKQPDLGTALMMLAGGGVLFFVAGVRLWKFAVVFVAGLSAIPVAWQFLHEYQKRRVLTFLEPERDPLGAGYHILQSKIALGSGGLWGKGFLGGTQSHLNFLPEKQTDFIFVMLAEEFGMLAGMGLLLLYVLVLVYGIAISVRARNHFGRLVAIGVTVTFFLYVFINIAMVMGLIPVVGVPLPLVSYGGTAMLTLMLSFGLLMSVWVHRDVQIGRRGAFDEG
ncbi:rod shape-determining protein RodA [Roseospira visakhapatnamensis]|uniref:Peptidoglycan glycosyltransferase MrdB n=1 Tax=Roseospira visakhapatnamensis TaxID=390880 RepID=A0A7W6RBZ6_9PROT|nr:rod shape-determining protein RodA [Roseospira visakhapatnamensis]MBB4265169.1 rod shape determining protein RodA [Roseospira visakhapatnamensis]